MSPPDGTGAPPQKPWEVDYAPAAPAASAAPGPADQKPWEVDYSPPASSNHSALGDIGRSALGALETGAGQVVKGMGDFGQAIDQHVPGMRALDTFTGLTPEKTQAAGTGIEQVGTRQSQNVSPQFAQKTNQSILSKQGFNATNIATKAIDSVASMAPALAMYAIPGAGPVLGTAAFAAQGEAGGREGGEQQVDAMTPTELAAVPRYQALIESGLAPEAAKAQFKQEVANRQGVVGGAFGGVLGIAGKIPGVEQLGEAAGRQAARVIGERAGKIVGKAAGEAAGFGGIMGAGQAISNVSSQIPTPIGQGVGEAIAGGVLPGALLGGVREFVKPSGPLTRAADKTAGPMTAEQAGAVANEPAPPAAPQPGRPTVSAADLTNRAATRLRELNIKATDAPETMTPAETELHGWLQQNIADPQALAGRLNVNLGDPEGKAQPPVQTTRLQPPDVPWVNTESGEVTSPTDNQVLTALHGIKDQQDAATAQGNKLATSKPQIAAAWGISAKRLQGLWTQANRERKTGTTTTDSIAREQQEPQQAPLDMDPSANLAADSAAQKARMDELQGNLDKTGDSLADIRTRIDQLNAQRGIGPGKEPDSLAASPDQLSRLTTLQQKRAGGEDYTPEETSELLDLHQRDAMTARIAGNGRRIPGVQNMEAFHAREAAGTLAPHFAFADADNFKSLNDNLGHHVGDDAIASLGKLMSDELGAGNVFHRGGDEFLLNHTDPQTLQAGLDRVRSRLADAEWVGTDAEGNTQTHKGLGISFGIGDNAHAAEQAQSADKTARLDAGLRTDRRQGPRGTPNDRRGDAQVDQTGVQASEAGTENPTQGQGETQGVAADAPKLPEDLANGKPRYQKAIVQFDSDVDKAAYIVSGKGVSKHHDAYVKWLADHAGMDEAQAAAHGAKVRAVMKAQAEAGAKAGELRIPKQPRGLTLEGEGEKPAAPPELTGQPENTGKGPQDEGADQAPVGAAEPPVAETTGKVAPEAGEVPRETSESPSDGGIGGESTAKSGENQGTAREQPVTSKLEDVETAMIRGRQKKGVPLVELATGRDPNTGKFSVRSSHQISSGGHASPHRGAFETRAEAIETGLKKLEHLMPEKGSNVREQGEIAKIRQFIAAQRGKIETQGKAAPEGQPAPELPANYGNKNTLFTKEAADAARERLRKKLGTVRSGLDPEMVQDGITMAGYHIEAGAHKFADYAKAMVDDLGEAAKPYLRSWYEAVRHYPGNEDNGAKMSDAAEIEAHNKAESSRSNAPNTPQADGGVEAAAKAEKNDTDGFAESLPKLRQKNVRAALAKQIVSNGEPITRRDLVRKRVADGATIDTAHGGRRLTTPAGSYLAEKDISKTAMDYAAYLREHPRQGKEPNAESSAPVTNEPTSGTFIRGYRRRSDADALAAGKPDYYVEPYTDRAGDPAWRVMSKEALPDALDTKPEALESVPESAQTEPTEPTNDSSPARRPAKVHKPLPDGHTAADIRQWPPDRGTQSPRAGSGQDDDAGLRSAGTSPDGTHDESGHVGDRVGPAIVPNGSDDPLARSSGRPSAHDFRASPADLIRTGSWFDSAKRNIDLIDLARKIDSENRDATPEEQAQLVQYVGFGSGEIRNALFPIPGQYLKQANPGRLIFPEIVDGRWKPLAERMAALPREWQESVLQSTQYAHYTSGNVVSSIWSALQRLGFNGGRMLEPGSGKGTFAMLMPDSMRQSSRFTGVEFDGPTALIGRLLSPQQDMLHADFTKRNLPHDYYDAAVGNPPFASTRIVSDPEYAKYKFSLHDYFFAKSLDRVRPGGLVAFVTSRFTMDKQRARARKYLAERADLLGAIRLPSTAFEANAGTSVVADVLFLRKRAEGEEPAGFPWQDVVGMKTKDGDVAVNQYFADNPDMVLGQQRISGNHDDEGRRINSNGRGGEHYTVVSYDKTPEELDAKFAAAVEKLPANAYSEFKGTPAQIRADTAKLDFDPKVKREGVVYMGTDGRVMLVNDGIGVPLDSKVRLTPKDRTWFKSYVGLRDLVNEARLAQVSDGDWVKALKTLNKAYDKHVKAHGNILEFRTQTRKSTAPDGAVVESSSRVYKNARLWREDYDSSIVRSLEKVDKNGDIQKGHFLLDRTIGKPVVREIKTMGDALAVSLDETGALHLGDIAQRLNITPDEAIEALGDQIYKAPAGNWELRDQYLSGDVVQKLADAEVAARDNPELKRNVDALKAVQPDPLGPSRIGVKLGAAWVPAKYVTEYAAGIGAGHVTFDPTTESWQVEGGSKRTKIKAAAEYGTAARSPSVLLEAALNSRTITVKEKYDDPSGETRTRTDVDATTAATEAIKRMKEKFQSWVWTDTDRAADLVDIYNRTQNNIAPRQFNGDHLTLPGVSLKFTLHPHVKRAIWRQIQTGDTYLAHAVGAGKTIEMIAGGMEQKRLGLIKKPMYVVPNHMLEQFSNEFMDLYPLANIMVADDHAFSKDRRKAFVAAATLNAPDAIVITHSAQERIGVKEETVAPVRDRMISDLEDALADTDNTERVRRSQLQQQIEAVTQRFDRIVGAKDKDNTINFEDMGVDFLYVDEAHAYRKLDFTTQQQVKGIDANGSRRALDMFVKTQYLESRKPGRAMVFASGTPVTNTMGELYTIMRFFAQKELDNTGTATFDSWARQFGEIVPALEANAAGRYEVVSRFAKFDNVPEMMSRIRQFMDVLTSQNLGALVKRPDLEGGVPNMVLVKPTPELTAYMKNVLLRRLTASRKWKPTKNEPFNPDPVLAIISDGRFAALDPRFFGGTVGADTPTKITAMGDAIAAEYHATAKNKYVDDNGKDDAKPGAAQVVFYNMGFGAGSMKNRSFDARDALTQRMVERGVKRNEIKWFDEANTDAKKENVFRDVRSGKIRVLIGSSKKMGTGVNVQNRLSMLHYFDPPWYPSDVEQPHGRIIRQGNQNPTVRINWYATETTYDSTMWGMVGRKQRFIDQAFSGDKNLRTMEDLSEASMYEQAAAVASGDPRAMQLAGLRQDVERLERLQSAHANEQVSVKSALNRADWDVSATTKRVAVYEAALQAIGGEYVHTIDAKIGGVHYDKAGELGQAVKDAFNAVAAKFANKPTTRDQVLGTFNGHTVQMHPELDPHDKPTGIYDLEVSINGFKVEIGTGASYGADADAVGLGRRFTSGFNRISTKLEAARKELSEFTDDEKMLRKKQARPFEHAHELAEKYRELKQLEDELRSEGEAESAEVQAGMETAADGDHAVPPELERMAGETPVNPNADNFGMAAPQPVPADSDLLKSHNKDNRSQRQAMRRALVDERFAGHKPAPDGKPAVALVMGGGGASGKGSVLDLLREEGKAPPDAVHLDPDDFKTGNKKAGTKGLPEYTALAAAGDSRAAAVTHDESDRMYRMAVRRAIAGHYNLILDRTMSNAKKADAEMRELKNAGYFIRHVGVTVPVHEALARSAERSQLTPDSRFVPAADLIKAHRGYSAGGLDAVNKHADETALYDNFVGRDDKPIEIAHGGKGKLEIIDQERYNGFRGKANVNLQAERFKDLYQGRAGDVQRGMDGGPVARLGGDAGTMAGSTGRGDGTTPAPRRLDSQGGAGQEVAPDAEFSRPEPNRTPNHGGVDRAAAYAVITNTAARWGRAAPEVRLLDSAEQLPDSAKINPDGTPTNYQTAEGYYDAATGTAYLVRPNLADAARTQQVLDHESVGHFGMDRIVNAHVKGGWKRLTDDIARLRRDPARGTPALRDAINEVERRYPNANPSTFARELPAVMIEHGIHNGIMARVVAAVRGFLRKINPNIRYTDPEIRQMLAKSEHILRSDDVASATPAIRPSALEVQPTFSRPEKPADPSKEPRASIDNIEAVLAKPDEGGLLDKARAWAKGKYEDLRPAMLGALQTRHILELMEDVTPLKGAGKLYERSMRQMDADREQLMVGSADAKEDPKNMLKKGAVTIAQEMRSYAYGKGLKSSFGKVRPEAKELFDLMHASTLQRMDPSEKYERLTIENAHGDAVPWTHAEIKARLKLLKELAMQRGGDPWADREKLTDEVRYLRNLPKSERVRELNYPKLKARYDAMDPEGKRLFGETRDWYSQYRDETEKALIKNIERLEMPDSYKRGMVQRMRLQFEDARREGVYFPLNRDGDYWVAFKDVKSNEGFKMFENAKDFKAGVSKLRAAGFQIDATGRRDHNMKAKNAPTGSFVREIIDTLQKAKVSEHVQDEVYQAFLRSLPELSMRKHSIHRRNIAGFSEDAMRSFAKNGYHGAHQLARLRHAQAMELAVAAMKMSVDNWRRGENSTDERAEPNPSEVVRADALLGEMQKRHDWIMQPTDQSLANMVNSIGFIWYLGASPASAITNLTQTVQTVLPVLGAAHGWGKATRALGSAWKDAARTIGNMEKTLKNDDERRAFIQMQKQGDFSRTQAHTLAGLAEGNVLQTSPAWSKTMNVISWMFHTAEVVNREAAGMAAYRLARSEGKSFDQAVHHAGQVNADANFDYSAGNRPRYMQGNVQRIALQFKNYSVGMTWLFYRNLFQSMKGETPEVRRQARNTVAGILGMTAILAGATGLPIYNTVKMTANAANDLFGDDDPWNFDDAFHRWLADNLGPDAARLIAEGPTNYVTGANLSSRTSLANLWIQNDSQGLEGADAYHALLENLAGPIGGIVNNFYVGTEDIRRGKLERGFERMLPTATKNGIKALRYVHEGVNNMRGDPIVPDVSTSADLLQAIGFQPSRIANQWRLNTAAKNFTSEIQDQRTNAMNAYAMAVNARDPGDIRKALANIRTFNARQPTVAINAKTLIASLRQRARLSAKAEHGIFINPKLRQGAQQYVGGQQDPAPPVQP